MITTAETTTETETLTLDPEDIDTNDASDVARAASTAPDNVARAASTTAERTTRRFNIPGDTVRKATAQLPADQRDAILWLHAYGWEQNIPYEELATKLRQPNGTPYDRHTVYAVLTGRHNAGKENIVQAIQTFRKLVAERATITRAGFIPTRLAKRIHEICTAALTYQRFALIFGPTQIGKTEALTEYARAHNHGQTIYLRMPEGGRYQDFIRRFASVLKISPGADNVKDRIIQSFTGENLLIIDEAHQSFLSPSNQTAFRPIEFIREIWDEKKCGVVLCATDLLDDQFQRGSLKGVLRQISERRLLTLRLPAKPTRADLNAIAAHYQLPPATGDALQLQNDIIRDCGLGRWMTILQAASRVAAKQSARDKSDPKLAWTHVQKAHAAFLKLEDPNHE